MLSHGHNDIEIYSVGWPHHVLEVLITQLVLGFLNSKRWRIVLLRDENGVLLLENGFSRPLEVLVEQIDVNMTVHFV